MKECDVAIVGAGPYGLAARLALRETRLGVRIFGTPMSFWRDRMPAGMLLRSPWAATTIGPAGTGLTLDDYEASLGKALDRPLPLPDFVAYGDWVQQQSSPDLDRRHIQRVAQNGCGFRLSLEDGDEIAARHVVIAAGIEPFAARPEALSELPSSRASHSTDHVDLAKLSGASVLVVGAGQSALESAALLHEAGARVEVIVRARHVHWLSRSARLHRLRVISSLLYAPADIGPAGVSRLVALPRVFGRIPRGLQDRLAATAIRPAGAAWLVDRLRDVPITTGTSIVAAREAASGLCVRLSSGEERHVDHVLLGTGFRVDIARYPFLDRALISRVRTVNGYPVLRRGFETSVDGLHFLGAPAAWSHGPIMRFVAGTAFAAPRLARALAGIRSEQTVAPVPASAFS